MMTPKQGGLHDLKSFRLRKVDNGYDVLTQGGRLVGYTYRAPDQTWSYAPWVIEGVHVTVKGGVNGKQERRKGWPTRAAAIREIAVMNSAAISADVRDGGTHG